MSNSRFGFCCKYIPEDGDAQAARAMNTSTVTMAYLGRLDPKAAYDKLCAVVAHNLEAFRPSGCRSLMWRHGRRSSVCTVCRAICFPATRMPAARRSTAIPMCAA
jgi:hypothetical protein